MNKKKIFSWLGICAVVLILSAALMTGNVFGNTKYLNGEYVVRDLAIKTFDLDTKRVQVLFTADIFDNTESKSTDIKAKLACALTMLTDEKKFVPGDYKPIFFLEGNKVSIVIKHANGTISLTELDISKEKPVITRHIVKEAIL